MKDENKTKKQFIDELVLLRHENMKLKKSGIERKRVEEALKSSEERLKIIFKSAPDAYYLNDIKGTFIDGNKAAEDLLGYKREELIGKSFLKLKLLSAKELLRASKLLLKNIQGKGTGPDEFIVNRKDGSQLSIEIRTFPVKIKGQTLVLGIARDITERKQAEKELKESEERFKKLSNLTFEGILIHDNGIVINVNESLTRLLGYTREEMIGENISKLCVQQEYHATIKENIIKNIAKPYEVLARKKDGTLFPIEIEARDIKSKDGELRVVAIRDITERKQAEQALIESETKYRTLFSNIADPIVIFDKETHRFLDCNKSALERYGYTLDELRTMTPHQLHPPDELEEVDKNIDDEEDISPHSYTHITKKGEILYVEIHTTEVEYEGREAWISIIRNITERKKAEETLQEEVLRRSILMDASLDGIAIINQEHRVVEANQRFAEMLGYTYKEVMNLHTWDWEEDMSEAEIRANFVDLTKTKVVFETHHRRKDGTTYHVEVSASGAKVGDESMIFTVSRDITERKKSEEALKEKQYLNELLLNTFPHPAMLIAKDRKVLAMNKVAEEFGVIIGGYCWKEFRKNKHISPDDKKRALKNDVKGIKCTFCRADESLEGKCLENDPEVSVFEKIWDMYWVAIDQNMFLHYAVDITEKKKAEEAILQSQRDLGERVKELKGLSELRQLTDRNLSYGELFSYFLRDIVPPSMQFPEKTISRIVFDGKEYYGDGKRDITNCLSAAINLRGKKIGELKIGYSDDSGFVTEFEQNFVNAYATTISHYLEKKEYEQQIKSSLEEKTVLLQEVHHGVKNKLFTVMSLVDMQIEPYEEKDVMFKGDKVICDALMAFKHRVQVMATAHEMLYESESLAEIKYDEYINKRVQSLLQTYHVPGVVLEGNIDPNISLDIDKAGHLGLVVNELVTNTLKYAFPETYELHGGESKRISIDFQDNGNEYLLNVSDNGIGMPGDFKLEEINSLGLKLVYGLVTVQLDGTIELVKRDIGTRFEIKLPKTYKGRS